MMDDNFTDSAAFYYLCDMTPPRPLHDADMGGQGLPGFYPSNVDSFPQGSQMRQPSDAQLYQNGDRSETITHNPDDLSGEALPDAKTQWETVPRSCEGQYQEQWGVPQLVQSREREQLKGGAQKYVTRGSLLSRGVHLNNVQNFPSGSNHLNNLNSSAALLNPVNVDSRVNALSSSRKITLTSMHNQSMKPALPLKKIPGIGLHLNSVVSSFGGNSVQDARPNEPQARQNMGGSKPVSILRNHNLRDKMEMNPISSNVADHALANNAVSPQQQLKEIAQSNPQNISSTPSRKRSFFSEQTDSNEQLYQSSPNALGQSSGEGCKRCNCVRTKCLKLYCDCFAAGLYCARPCACQGCYNKPEYEDKITDARRQEELTPSTPSSSARHRRGCNCKKSMCTKKYCECYKEGVGCSEGCRCEGCQNEYGRKEDHGYSEDVARRRVSHGKEALGSDLTVFSSSVKIPTSPSHSSSDKHKERADSSSQCYEPITVCESMKKKNPPPQSYEQTVALNDSNYLANVPSSVAASASETKNCIGASSIRWQRSSLVTQIVPIGERINLQGFNSHGVFEKLEDPPSEILKESMPVNPADVDSPIRKRVRLQDLCSNSPVEFKSGRKYILKAVGTSTPLKPCNYQN